MSNQQVVAPANPNVAAQVGTEHNEALSVLQRGVFELEGVQRQSIVLDATEKSVATLIDEITSEELMAFVGKIESVQSSEVLSLLGSLFDFQGFDPIQIIKKLISINKYYQTKELQPLETQDTLKQDIMMMVSANIIMGNIQLRSAGRRSVKGRAALEYLVSKYKMRVGSTGAGLPSDTLTFPRVANSFPVLTCRSANVLPIKNLSKTPFSSSGVPKFMRVSAFASFCHEDLHERTRMFLLYAVCAYSCDHMMTVHEGEKKKRRQAKEDHVFLPEDAWSAQFDYIMVSSASPVPNITMKRAMLTEFKVAEIYSKILPVVQKVKEVLQDSIIIPDEKEFKADINAFVSGTKVEAITAS